MISFYIDKNLSWRNLHRTWSSLVAHGAVEIKKIEEALQEPPDPWDRLYGQTDGFFVIIEEG